MNRSVLYIPLFFSSYGLHAEQENLLLLPSLFVGIQGGYQWGIDDAYESSAPNAMLYGLYAGTQFMPSWQWGVGYQYHDKLQAEATDIDVKTWLLETAVRYDWYLADDWSLYGRAGLAYWNMAKMSPAADTINVKGFSPLGEVGMSYMLNRHFQVSLGYQYIDKIGKSSTGYYDSHSALFNFHYYFGTSSNFSEVFVPNMSNGDVIPVFKDTVITEPQISQLSSEVSVPNSVHLADNQLLSIQGLVTNMLHNDAPIVVFEHMEEPSDRSLDNAQYMSILISELALILNKNPEAKLLIEAHSESTGSDLFDQTLSERRAETVANQLYERGVSREQVSAVGKGTSQPIANNETEEGKARNGRIELNIYVPAVSNGEVIPLSKDTESTEPEIIQLPSVVSSPISDDLVDSQLLSIQGLVTDMLHNDTPIVIFEHMEGPSDRSLSNSHYMNMLTNELALMLNKNPDVKLLIEAHSGSTGSDVFDQTLSERSAETFANQLYERGVSREQLSAVGKGTSQPIANNETEEGKARNGRIELEIYVPAVSKGDVTQLPKDTESTEPEIDQLPSVVSAPVSVDLVGSQLLSMQGLVTDMLHDPTPMIISEIIDGFPIGSASVSQYFNKMLDELALVLIENPEVRLFVEGHTDSTGSAAFNQKLSERRAETVANQLYERGVSQEQISVMGKGKSDPIVSNATEKGRARNRRVELTISPF
ncbi:OmpA family protein [Vibrio cholerae]|uniref:OmpA family protein n=1 Tax=Vibrio cholerae TaxID=666 RepID=UPI000E6D59A2|nr:OmpA family protein [Vibrio cholerae]NOE11889.1 OmpA family protein [Vibrio cholerae]NOF32726.1 OmpA family protein [Vibrio cholerae]RJK82835.1 hypothetical protein CHN45_17135 [Vibrio cholerae]